MTKLVDCALAWAEADNEVRIVRRNRDIQPCDSFEPYEYNTGYPGTPVCWKAQQADNRHALCEGCERRQRFQKHLVEAKRNLRNAVNRLRRAAR